MRTALIAAIAVLVLTLSQIALAQEGQVTQSYVVQQGDTINSIAKRFYGKTSLGASLWRANRNLVAHPNRLTPGDTIYIFPESTLSLKKAVEMPPEPEGPPVSLYKSSELLNQSFPQFISFVTTVHGRSPTRVRIVRIDNRTGAAIDEYFEVRIVGEILSSTERGIGMREDGARVTTQGRTLLSTRDQVLVRFTEDLAKIIDSDTYDDPDPYFRSYPVYAIGETILEPGQNRPDRYHEVGQLMQFKGTLTVDARIEGLDPAGATVSKRAKRNRKNYEQDFDPVTYHATITYCEDPLTISDKVVVFVPLDPGPERRLDPPYVEPPDTFVSPGK
jgi:phage tail protein X